MAAGADHVYQFVSFYRVGDELRGPLGRGTRAAKDISLDPVAIADKFQVVTDVPETISQVFGEGAPLLVQ